MPCIQVMIVVGGGETCFGISHCGSQQEEQNGRIKLRQPSERIGLVIPETGHYVDLSWGIVQVKQNTNQRITFIVRPLCLGSTWNHRRLQRSVVFSFIGSRIVTTNQSHLPQILIQVPPVPPIGEHCTAILGKGQVVLFTRYGPSLFSHRRIIAAKDPISTASGQIGQTLIPRWDRREWDLGLLVVRVWPLSSRALSQDGEGVSKGVCNTVMTLGLHEDMVCRVAFGDEHL
ncbi:uncharacterized protein BCR38DRAFT_404427 [Pseudomassariella vexata]|uniref:Uncharacterized protein n=1 Tax=Pseudomassariella vexata TaxID=1141098 RepID=A0A1Y2EIC7_9PEZI|nr:uncharacterized protein BCR38DRAFT_404427 [Pseudomassariella vexata]ORY71332.1 hypothetical protein BCR38DRAFT_404427 [Pseudomassariella vexata]